MGCIGIPSPLFQALPLRHVFVVSHAQPSYEGRSEQRVAWLQWA